MASIIRIKRSSVTGNPGTLGAGELAYSALADNGSNGGDRLYIGIGTETAGNAVNHIVIGGKYFTDLVNAATNNNTASTIVKRDASGNFSAGTITASLSGSATSLSTGRTIALTGDVTYTSSSFDGTANVTGTATLANTTVTAGSYGSSTAIPTFTVDSKGRLTAAGTATISTTLSLNAGGSTSASVGLGTDNLTFTGSSGISTSISKTSTTATLTIGIDSTVATLTGSQTLTDKTLTSPLISSITGVSGNFAITAAAGNNNINLTPTGTGTVDASGKRITSVADPTQAQDAATKAYVDSMSSGLDVKQSVRAASTSALTVTYSNGTAGVGATLTNAGTQAALTLDSIALSSGDRVLIKDQASALQNGVYVVTTVGSVSVNWVLTRATDFDNSPGTEVSSGTFFFVEEGTAQGDNGYVVTTDGAITIGTTAIVFNQFSGGGQVVAGAGLTKNGSTIDAVGTANRITVNADSIDIASTYVGQSSITTLGTIGTGVWQGSIIGSTYGGTGVNNGSNTITLGGSIVTASSFTTSGAYGLTLTQTGTTNVTLPTNGTLATLDGSETFTNKTLTLPTINGGALSGTFSGGFTASGIATFSSATASTSTSTGAVVISTGGLGVSGAIYVGTNITGAGASTSTLDGFQIDGGTY